MYDDVQAGNRRKRRRATSAISNRGDEAPALLGRLLLDSGALGRCVVSSSFFDKIVRCKHDIAEHNVEHDLISAIDNNVITNKEVSFNILVTGLNKNDCKRLAIPVTAIVADINVYCVQI